MIDEWEQRIVCPDGACTGIIGSDGVCQICGQGAASPGAPVVEATAEPDNRAQDDEWARRQLCSDGACLGVVGGDGRCTLCGKPP